MNSLFIGICSLLTSFSIYLFFPKNLIICSTLIRYNKRRATYKNSGVFQNNLMVYKLLLIGIFSIKNFFADFTYQNWTLKDKPVKLTRSSKKMQ
jgi:hypothetical protein